MPSIICDIDGTLADCRHRLQHVEGMTPNWEAFFAGIDEDPVNRWCAQLLYFYNNAGYEVYMVTGRPNRYREPTISWLRKFEIPYSQLFMRGDGDHRADDVVKREILQSSIKKDDVELVIDDRESVVKMWREEGLMCLQCNPSVK